MKLTVFRSCPIDPHHIGTYRFTRYDWPLFKCTICHHLWIEPLPTETELSDFYTEGYFEGDQSKRGYQHYESDKQTVLPIFQKYLDILEIHTRERHLLDIGAATGLFINLAKSRGWSGTGIELSEYAVTQAREHGHDVRQGRLEDHAPHLPTFPVVTMWDVIEHVRNPDHTVATIAKLLPSGGLFIFTAPQVDCWFAALLGKYWTLIAPPQHLHYFSFTSLNQLLTKYGFEIIETRWLGKIFDIPYILHFLIGWLNIKSPTIKYLAAHPRLRGLKLRINPHDVITVLAKKT